MNAKTPNHPNGGAPNIAIVGGGLGGLCLAICLIHHNIPVHIYEAARSFGEIGAGIMFGPHSVTALRLISSEVFEAFKRYVTFNQDPAKKMHWVTFRLGMDTHCGKGKMGEVLWQVVPNNDAKAMIKMCGTQAMCSAHRARLLIQLVNLLPEGVASFGKSLVKVEETPSGCAMYFADRTVAHADAVIGCDGIKSKARMSMMKSLGKVVEPEYVGQYAYRSLVGIDDAKRMLGEDLAPNANLWEGQGGYVITYPVEKGELINVVAVVVETNPDVSKHSLEQMIHPSSHEKMLRDFKDFDPRVTALLRELKSSDQWDLWHLQHDEP